MVPVSDRNHATLVSDPDPQMMDLIRAFLDIRDEDGYAKWLVTAQASGEAAKKRMLVNPGKNASGLQGEVKEFFGHLFHEAEQEMDGWQQFVVHARDERGDPVTDYMIDVLRKSDTGEFLPFAEIYTDVHAYKADQSFRCFHIRLPKGLCDQRMPLQIRVTASTGTALMAYQGYGTDDTRKTMTATAGPVTIDVNGIGDASLFFPFTTTLVEVVLNREPFPLDQVSEIFKFLRTIGATAAP
jgi:hypothetical protein